MLLALPQSKLTLTCGLVMLSAWGAYALCDRFVQHPVASLACFGLAFGAYALAAARLLKQERLAQRAIPLGFVVAVAILCRLMVIPTTPTDDMHRYIWEGRVTAAGHNPYVLAPDAPALQQLATTAPEHPLINHPSWPAIYPPLMQWWHRGVVAVAPRELAFKLSFLLAELGLCLCVFALLSHRGLPRSRLLLYVWNPLAIHSTAATGHHDVVAVACLFAAFLLLSRRRLATAAAAVACALLAKGFVLATLPAFLAARRWARPSVWFVPALVGLLLATPFLLGGSGLFDSLSRFGSTMHTNDSLHALAATALSPDGSRFVMLVVWAGVACFAMRNFLHSPEEQDLPLKTCAILLGALILTLPTVHPWYLMTLLPFFCFFPWWGWIALSGTMALTWLPQLEIRETGQWVEWPLLKLPEYAPLFLWLVLLVWKRWRHGALETPR